MKYPHKFFLHFAAKKESDLALKEKRMSILREIRKAESDLNMAYCNYDMVDDPVLIDYYIYELNALSLKYKFLLNTAREMELHEVMPTPVNAAPHYLSCSSYSITPQTTAVSSDT